MESIFNIFSEEKKEELKKDMSTYQRKIFEELETNEEAAANYNLKNLLFDFDKEFIEKVLKEELEIYYNSHREKNRMNGFIKGVELVVGNTTIKFNRPRLRDEKGFDSIIIPKRTKFLKDITDDIIMLYSKNNSVNDIKEILKGMFDIDISTATISSLAQTISTEVITWRNKELENCYFTINIDCTYIKIRDRKNLVGHKVPIYVAIGTKLNGHKEVVGLYLGNEDEEKNVIDELYNKDIGESKTFWLTVFGDLKDRGVEEVMFVVSDGIKGMKEAVKQEFSNAIYQRCVVHLVRDLCAYIPNKEKSHIIKDFKKIYTAINRELSEEAYNDFIKAYKSKKTLIKKVEEYYEYIKPLFNLPEGIREYVYTNNIVESANSKIKRGFYGRGALPNVESALNIIYLNLKDLEEKWAKRKVSNWDKIFNELQTLYPDIMKKYI